MLKQRNDELFEENRRLKHELQRQQQNLAWRSTLQQAYADEPQPPPPPPSQQKQGSHMDNVPPSSPLKTSSADSRRDRPKSKYRLIVNRNSPTMRYHQLTISITI